MSLLSIRLDSGYVSDNAYGQDSATPKFPHTRAQLSAIARQYKPLDSYDSEAEGDEFGRVSSSFVNRVVAMLVDEQDDELKALLKETYGIDEDTVCGFRVLAPIP